jgi:hypothetical protein
MGGAVLAPPSSAGGASWITPERPAYVPADVAVFEGRFWQGSNEVTIADSPYLAYLLPRNRCIDGLRVAPAAIPIGELVVSRVGVDVFLTTSLERRERVFMRHLRHCQPD